MQSSPSYSAIMKVATPVMFGVVVEFIVAFIDTAFLGTVSELALNTAGNAGLLYITFYMTGQGLASAMQIIIARRYGAKRYADCGRLTGQSAILQFLFGCLLFVSYWLFGHYIVSVSVESVAISNSMISFLNIRTIGYLIAMPSLALISFYTGIGKTKALVGSMFVLSIINIIGDYVLINGKYGFPMLGANGAAIASVLAEGGALVYLIIHSFYYAKKYPQFKLGTFVFHKRSVLKSINLGVPLMAQRFLAMASWTVFFLLIEKLGSAQLAMSQVVRTLYFLAFIPIMGFSIATKTFVSQALGDGKAHFVKGIINKCLILAIGITVVTSHGVLLYPEFLVSTIVDEPYLIEGAAAILKILFPSMILFSISGVLFSTVSGAGNTKMAFLMEAASIIVYLFAAYLITIIYPQPVHYVWMLEYLYFGFLIIVSMIYLKTGHWKKIKV